MRYQFRSCGGTLLAFRRNEDSFHGFRPCGGERRSIQMFWVEPKRAARVPKSKRKRLAKLFKRMLRHEGPRAA